MKLYKEIEKTFAAIEASFSKEELLIFRDTPISDLYLYHFSLGVWIRNNLLQQKESILYGLFHENHIEHPDDMSYVIIMLFHRYITYKV